MKLVIRYDDMVHPPVLTMYIHGCPHKRQHRAVLQQFRDELTLSATRQISHAVDLPIDHPIDLVLSFTNPASPDLDHLLEAVFMAMDAKSLKGPSILKDDRHIQKVTMSKMYIGHPTKRDGAR
jgi:Holliday junction resolvase RusA-like endonuclease